MKFEVGQEADFYGVDCNRFKLNGTVFEAVEDESDGYRSMMHDVAIVEDTVGLIFYAIPFARVKIEDNYDFSGYNLVDVSDGHVWLTLGTDNYDDYYPCFTFNYFPKAA